MQADNEMIASTEAADMRTDNDTGHVCSPEADSIILDMQTTGAVVEGGGGEVEVTPSLMLGQPTAHDASVGLTIGYNTSDGYSSDVLSSIANTSDSTTSGTSNTCPYGTSQSDIRNFDKVSLDTRSPGVNSRATFLSATSSFHTCNSDKDTYHSSSECTAVTSNAVRSGEYNSGTGTLPTEVGVSSERLVSGQPSTTCNSVTLNSATASSLLHDATTRSSGVDSSATSTPSSSLYKALYSDIFTTDISNSGLRTEGNVYSGIRVPDVNSLGTRVPVGTSAYSTISADTGVFDTRTTYDTNASTSGVNNMESSRTTLTPETLTPRELLYSTLSSNMAGMIASSPSEVFSPGTFYSDDSMVSTSDDQDSDVSNASIGDIASQVSIVFITIVITFMF